MLDSDPSVSSVAKDAGPHRLSRRRLRLAGHARACVLWGLALFAIAHLVLLIGTQRRWPQLRDPEYGYKLNCLRKQLATEPERSLLVLLGSSRTGQGFRPGALPDGESSHDPAPFVFNFSMVGSGPLAELLCLRRLLDEGVRPSALAIEILPPLLGRKLDACGDPEVGISRLTWSDVRLLRRYVPEPDALAHRWIDAQLAPWHAHRFSIMNHFASDWLPWRLRLDHWKHLDRFGWSDLGLDTENPVKDPQALEVARKTYQDELKSFHIAPMQDRALRDLIDLCRRERIPTVLYLMPEGSIFQSWYLPATRTCIEEYLTRISREYSIPVVDARHWMADDYFWDSHHLDRRGATRFTRRFGQEVIPYLLAGQFDAIRPVLDSTQRNYPAEGSEGVPRVKVPAIPVSRSSISIRDGTPAARPPKRTDE